MCGFGAVIGLNGAAADVRVVRRMADVLAHRGPDDAGFHSSANVAFGFRRLSILDLSQASHQPFVSDDGQLVMVFNGEIFNYVELRRELIALGHRFRSTGDTEVLLRSYQQWGRDCVRKFNGMWAFLIHDLRRGVVWGSRDRFGVKPLYYRRVDDTLLFASEIKALRAATRTPLTPNWSQAATFLCVGGTEAISSGGATFYRDVWQLPAGTAFEVGFDGNMRQWKYWSLPEELSEAPSDAVERVRDLLTDSVKLRLRSDVPVGVSLSGGLDSTSILSIIAGERRNAPAGEALPQLHAFSYMPPEFDESKYVLAVTDATGAVLHRAQITPDAMWESLPSLLRFHDEPVHAATAFVGFEIYRLAAQTGIKVLLTGQGADETFAGYPSYFSDRWYTDLRRGRALTAVREATAYCRGHGRPVGRELARLASRAALIEANRLPPYRALMRDRRARVALPYRDWFSPDLQAYAFEPEQRAPGGHTLRDHLVRSTEFGPLPLYLRIEDRNSMAHSVEARLPFMDYRLVSYAFQLPGDLKIRGPWNKYVVREAMKGILLEDIRTRRDKMGFPTPVSGWLAGPLRQRVRDVIQSREFRERGIYDTPAIQSALERHARGEADVSGGLFPLVQFELWLDQVNQNEPVREPSPVAVLQ